MDKIRDLEECLFSTHFLNRGNLIIENCCKENSYNKVTEWALKKVLELKTIEIESEGFATLDDYFDTFCDNTLLTELKSCYEREGDIESLATALLVEDLDYRKMVTYLYTVLIEPQLYD